MERKPENSCDDFVETGGGEVVSCLCHCGRAPRRPSQRNCRLCHAEANRRYRLSLKKQDEALRRLIPKLHGRA